MCADRKNRILNFKFVDSTINIYVLISYPLPTWSPKLHQKEIRPPMAALPFDVISDIFLRLPLKPLIRVKLVCKTWRDLITGSFLQLHFIKSRDYNSAIYTQSVVVGGYRCLYFVEDIDCPSDFIPTKLTWPSCMLYGNVHVMGTCNGLVCLCSSPYLECFVICNPWTRHMRVINCPHASSGYCKHRRPAYLGFGYDSHNDDYKIIVIEEGDGVAWSMFLYNFKSSSWKRLLHSVSNRYETRPPRSKSGYFVNDRLHWIARVKDNSEFCIVRFNLCTEQWEDEFCVPVYHPRAILMAVDLGLVHGCLCLTVRSNDRNTVEDYQTWDLWMMREYGVHESWSFRYRIISHRMEFAPVAYSRKGCKALCRGATKLYWYDYEQTERKDFEVNLVVSDRVPKVPWHCVGSLLPIPGSSRMKVES